MPSWWSAQTRPGTGRARWLAGQLARWIRTARWPIIIVLAALALILGIDGYAEQPPNDADTSPLSLFYLSLQLFTLQGAAVPPPVPPALHIARLLAPAVAASATFLALLAVFSEQLAAARTRLLREHVIVCGLGRTGLLLAEALLARGQPVVAIESQADNPAARLFRDRGGAVLVGDATSAEVLRRAGIGKARYVLALCGDDATNAEVGARARELARDRDGSVLTVLAHVFNPELCELLGERAMGSPSPNCRLEFFNILERGARALLGQHPPAAQADGRPPRLAVVGLDELGEQIIVQAARAWWLDGFAASAPLGVIAVGPRAEQQVGVLSVRHPALTRAARLEAHSIDPHGPELRRADFLFNPDGSCRVTAVYVCLDDDAECLSTALALLQRLRARDVPIVAALRRESSLARLLRTETGQLDELSAFQVFEQTCTPELLLGSAHETLAQAIHAEWLRGQTARGISPAENSLAVPWPELPEETKESNRRQADDIGLKLAAVGYRIEPLTEWDTVAFAFGPDEIDLMARLEHERWLAERTAAGWTLGPRDPERKTNPAIMPWDDLPGEFKETNRDFVRGLPAFLARAGFQVARLPR